MNTAAAWGAHAVWFLLVAGAHAACARLPQVNPSTVAIHNG